MAPVASGDAGSLRSFLRYGLLLGALPASEVGTVSAVPVDTETLGVLATRLYWQRPLIREFSGPQEEAPRMLGLIERNVKDTQ